MEHSQVIEHIKRIAQNILPKGSLVYLYGSRARGDFHRDSDWDILILIDKEHLTFHDYDITYSFSQLGWEIGEDISAHLYTIMDWESSAYLPYHKNVENDSIKIL